MRKRKLYSTVLSAALVSAMVLTACSGSSGGGGGEGGSSGDAVELEFLFGDPNRTEIFSRIVEDFNSSQDEVHVTFNATGTNHLEELMTRLLQMTCRILPASFRDLSLPAMWTPDISKISRMSLICNISVRQNLIR